VVFFFLRQKPVPERQLLSDDLRILFNFSMDSENPFILFLAGQKSLRNRLQMGINTPLRQRINVKYHLQGLKKDELKDYIHTRLKYAGTMETNLFSDSALVSIFTITKGAP
jgi:general secretion pathway protein A